MAKMLLLYLHGFNSSPRSVKAQQMAQYIHQHHPEIDLEIPQLPPYPAQAWQAIEQLLRRYPEHRVGVVGSSLGGFLATRVNQQFGFPAVLVNPAVKPYALLTDYLGENTNPYTDEKYTLVEAHMNELLTLDCGELSSPEKLWVLLQTADEVLDYRQAEQKYRAAKITVEQGGDHSFCGFERYLGDIITFLALSSI